MHDIVDERIGESRILAKPVGTGRRHPEASIQHCAWTSTTRQHRPPPGESRSQGVNDPLPPTTPNGPYPYRPLEFGIHHRRDPTRHARRSATDGARNESRQRKPFRQHVHAHAKLASADARSPRSGAPAARAPFASSGRAVRGWSMWPGWHLGRERYISILTIVRSIHARLAEDAVLPRTLTQLPRASADRTGNAPLNIVALLRMAQSVRKRPGG